MSTQRRAKLMYSPLTDGVYWGRCNGCAWSVKNRDVTEDFLQIMIEKFPVNTPKTISIDGEHFQVIVTNTTNEHS